MVVELRPHQVKAVGELSNGKILCGGVGTGKTITGLAYFYTRVCDGVLNDLGSIKSPRDIYVITTARKRDSFDWQDDAAKLCILPEREKSVAGIKLTVDSWNNIDKYKDVENAFFLFDEQRVVGSGAWTKSFIKIAKSNQWLLLSATPGDTWLDYIPVFVANGYYKNRTQFIREHCVYNYFGKYPKLERYVSVGKLVKLRKHILVDMPYERHTTRHIHEVTVDYDRDLFEKVVKKRWHVYEDRPLKDVSELFGVMRRVVNTDASRLDTLKKLVKTHPKVIVFYNFDYELEILRSLVSNTFAETSQTGGSTSETSRLESSMGDTQILRSLVSQVDAQDQDVTVAEWNGHKHEPIPDSDSWIYLVQYVAGAEAWNCVETDTVVFWSLTYSYKNYEQSQGRIDRLNTPFSDLHYYVLKSEAMIDKAIWKALRAKKSFNERDFVQS